MALLGKCLLLKYKDLYLDPKHSHKKPGVVAGVCHLNSADTDTGMALEPAGK